jgi:soluble lytic murein transglycosylase
LAKRGRLGRIVFLIVLLSALYVGYKKAPDLLKILYPYNYRQAIIKYATQYSLDPNLIAAVIKAESNFYVFAESKKGAMGLMQITPPTGKWIAEKLGHKDFDKEMLFNPDTNISFGCWYIDYLSKHYDYNFKYVFAAYNGGEGNVDRWIKSGTIDGDVSNLDDIPYEETKKYVKKITRNYKIYKLLYGK